MSTATEGQVSRCCTGDQKPKDGHLCSPEWEDTGKGEQIFCGENPSVTDHMPGMQTNGKLGRTLERVLGRRGVSSASRNRGHMEGLVCFTSEIFFFRH